MSPVIALFATVCGVDRPKPPTWSLWWRLPAAAVLAVLALVVFLLDDLARWFRHALGRW